MELSNDEKLAIAIGFLELGKEKSANEINDFKRCTQCKTGYFVSATSRTDNIKCPYCGNVQVRIKVKA